MGNLGPVYLAWSHIMHRRRTIIGPLMVLMLCHILLFTQVGVLLMPFQEPTLAPLPAGEAENGRAEPLPPIARGVGVLFVFLVVLVLFQHIALTELVGHTREFAVLRTLGYPSSYVLGAVLAEMLLLVLIAFFPATALTPGVDGFVWAWTGWPLKITLGRVGLVLLVALTLSTVAALVVYRRVHATEPRDLFG